MHELKINNQTPHIAKHVLGDCASSEVYLMDCIEGMKYYPDKHFDLAVVDPPYGIGHSLLSGAKRGSKFNRNDHNVDWDIKPSAEYFLELFRVSKNQNKVYRKFARSFSRMSKQIRNRAKIENATYRMVFIIRDKYYPEVKVEKKSLTAQEE